MKSHDYQDILKKTAGIWKDRMQDNPDYLNDLRMEWENREVLDPAKHAFVKAPYRKN